MLVYMTYLKKGERKMEELSQTLPINFDKEKYNQMVEFRKKDLYNRGQMLKLRAYELVRQQMDMETISEETGLTMIEILKVIKEINPLMYTCIEKSKCDSENQLVKFR